MDHVLSERYYRVGPQLIVCLVACIRFAVCSYAIGTECPFPTASCGSGVCADCVGEVVVAEHISEAPLEHSQSGWYARPDVVCLGEAQDRHNEESTEHDPA